MLLIQFNMSVPYQLNAKCPKKRKNTFGFSDFMATVPVKYLGSIRDGEAT